MNFERKNWNRVKFHYTLIRNTMSSNQFLQFYDLSARNYEFTPTIGKLLNLPWRNTIFKVTSGKKQKTMTRIRYMWEIELSNHRGSRTLWLLPYFSFKISDPLYVLWLPISRDLARYCVTYRENHRESRFHEASTKRFGEKMWVTF